MATNGTLILGSVTDAELIKILEIKEKTTGMGFNPQQCQMGGVQAGKQLYNNVTITFPNGEALSVAAEVIKAVTNK